MSGRILQLRHPLFAALSCGDCKKWLYDDDGRPTMRNNYPLPSVPMARPEGKPTPCYKCPKFGGDVSPSERTPENGATRTLSEKNSQVVRHYLECRAVGQFPDDPLVRRHAMLLRSVEDAEADRRQRDVVEAVMAVVTLAAATR